jgi:hypothetical protein
VDVLAKYIIMVQRHSELSAELLILRAHLAPSETREASEAGS